MKTVTLDRLLSRAVSESQVPFVVGMVGNAEGITYSGAAGEAASGRAVTDDSLFRLFSMTKAIGALAAMILIDRAQLALDTPVGDVLPSWDSLQVLEGFDGDEPILRPAKTRATVRHLATHTSGLEYNFWCSNMSKYAKVTAHPSVLTGRKQSLLAPLMSDPGTRWGYGMGIDWLGQVVEAVDGRSIDRFCHQEIFTPLGMKSTVFELQGREDNLCSVYIRGENGRFATMDMAPPSHPEFYGMGHALYSTPRDYMRFLRMILNGGQLEENRVLSQAALSDMLDDQMMGLKLETMVSLSPVSADVLLPADTVHSFLATRRTTDEPNKRSAGSQSWAGILNTHFWVDPAKDVCAVLMTQSLPFVEPAYMKTYDAFERAVYADH